MLKKINHLALEIKGLKEFKGHDGESLLQGNLYYKNKKIGFVSMDSWGGAPRLELDDNKQRNEIERLLKEIAKQLDDKHLPYETSINELLFLKDFEQDLKRKVKQKNKPVSIIYLDSNPYKIPIFHILTTNKPLVESVYRQHFHEEIGKGYTIWNQYTLDNKGKTVHYYGYI